MTINLRSGSASNEILLRTVRERPGLSMYELGREIGWNIGRVDGCVRRLLNAGKLRVAAVERNGRRTNLVFPKSKKDPRLIEVPTSLLGNPTFSHEAFSYALDSTTIGISGRVKRDWEEDASFMEKTSLKRSKRKISLKLPERFLRFYRLDEKRKVVTVNGDVILVTVSGDLIQSKKYPS